MNLTAADTAALNAARHNKGIVPWMHVRYMGRSKLATLRDAGYLRRQNTGSWKITLSGRNAALAASNPVNIPA